MKTPLNFSRSMALLALITGLLLLIPLVAMQFSAAVNWSPLDFAIMGILIFGTGLAYILVARKADNIVYRIAAGIALAATFLLIWADLAVGLIGAGPNLANLMYIGVLGVGIMGAVKANFKPRGMVWAIFAVVSALVLVTVVTLIRGIQYSPGSAVMEILGVNGFFIILFTLSALLFRYAALKHKEPRSGAAGKIGR